jgi:hypothetical protein
MSYIRFKIESRKLTKIQRLNIWWNGVLNAIREVPDTHYYNYVQVREGEEGYNEAAGARGISKSCSIHI